MKNVIQARIKKQNTQKKSHDINSHIFLYLIIFLLPSCQSRPPTSGTPPPGQLLTQIGTNEQARFSSNGEKIIFVSSSRPAHNNSEIYEMTLVSQKERRVSFQDGEVSSPVWDHRGQKIYYFSNSDYKKQWAFQKLNKNNSAALSNQADIIISDLNGLKIQKLLSRTGLSWQSTLSLGPNGQLVYKLQLSGEEQIRRGGSTILARSSKKTFSSPAATWTHNDVAWAEESTIVRHQISQPTLRIQLLPGQIQDLTWAQKKLIFSAQFAGHKQALFALDFEKKCFSTLLDHKDSNLSQPDMSNDLKSLVFTSDWRGTRQIYFTTIDWEKLNCLPFDRPL